ncbi:MAG: PilT/PilU family type 4a pilus ATPase [Chloroflexi bacterium]|nr:PilT/PilU family type 4a pilus ATPase [Chloroflexota bacterium]
MDIFALLLKAKAVGASDLHLVVSSPPLFRVRGGLEPADGSRPLSPEEINEAFAQITTPQEREHFATHLELDFAYSLPGVGRLRGNAAKQRGAISLAIRLLPQQIPTIDEMELPQIYKDLALRPRGLLVVTGPTGSGKSTTQAAMIQHLNLTESRHVVTIEDPIEYIYESIKCAVTQRQLGSDTHSFSSALKHVLRQDPNMILVGEMRDLETASAVLTLAETGHMVMSTGHAPSAPQAIERVIDMFPLHERPLAQARLASLLIAVLCQVLVPRADGSGRIAAAEIMLANPPVKNLIREGKIYLLYNVIRTHREIGMITMDEALVNLYLRQAISGESLMSFCNDRQEVEKLIGRMDIKKDGQPKHRNGVFQGAMDPLMMGESPSEKDTFVAPFRVGTASQRR